MGKFAHLNKYSYFCIRNRSHINNTIMALEIKAIPTLHGDAAERFLKLIDVSSEERKKRGGIKRDPQMVKKVLQKAGLR